MIRFLSDKRVVHWPRAIWLPILRGIVARVRPSKVKPIYDSIWLDEGSPLTVYTQRQAGLLADAFLEYEVKYAMTATEPTISEALDEFDQLGVTDLTIIPLYPQFAPSTVASVTDQVFDYYRNATRIPNLKVITEFPTEPSYISWYANALKAQIDSAQRPFDKIVFSLHGVPVHPAQNPVYYREQCEQTVTAIMGHPSLKDCGIPSLLTFQSRFGPGEWLTPATIDTMGELPSQGVKSVLVCTPGFVADCIETIDEIEVLNRREFTKAGGQYFVYQRPINDDPVIVEMVRNLLNEF